MIVNVSLNLDNIITIDENVRYFKTKMTLVRSWINSQLTYLNLKKKYINNLISAEDRARMWYPRTVFKSTEYDGSPDVKIEDRDMMVIIPHPGFTFERSDRTHFVNSRFFKGDENIISYERRITVNWMCHFDMRWYPFDTQICIMEIFSWDLSVTLNPTFVNYTGPVDLPQHFVKNVMMCKARFNEKSGIAVKVFLGRPLFGTILSVFMPTSIFLVLSQLVRVFNKNHLELIIDVNLTLMLVLATL